MVGGSDSGRGVVPWFQAKLGTLGVPEACLYGPCHQGCIVIFAMFVMVVLVDYLAPTKMRESFENHEVRTYSA